MLLLIMVVSAGMMVAARASTPRPSTISATAAGHPAMVRSRTRPETDISRIEGIHRWGLNE